MSYEWIIIGQLREYFTPSQKRGGEKLKNINLHGGGVHQDISLLGERNG
jgi:hypothetical protein